MKIKVSPSPTADTRTCNVNLVDKAELIRSTNAHINDVQHGLKWVILKLYKAGKRHDYTKKKYSDLFLKCFKSGFRDTEWYDLHKSQERHHISAPEVVREDVDLIDVIEFLVDGVMAGIARSGSYKAAELPKGLLEVAFNNTVKKLINDIEVTKGD